MDCERADDHFNIAGFRRCDIPGWPECVGFVMKSPTEMERIAARRIAKALVEELKSTLSGGGLKQEECSQRISEAIQRESRKTGISELLLKSTMMRIQENRL
ncbi:MAG: hypothetical protein ACRC8G_09055 [Plesiomonas shigelloides]